MSAATTPSVDIKTIVSLKDDKFDIDHLHDYCLSIQLGIRDVQLCVVDTKNNRTLVLEDYLLLNIKTINSRLAAVKKLVDNHSFVKAGFWKEVKISLKTHKFTLVPSPHFVEEAMVDYLAINSTINAKIEDVYYYKHVNSSTCNIFAADSRMVSWFKSLYPKRPVNVVHQGSALIQGILKYKDHTHEKMMFCMIDKGILHIAVTWQLRLLYYNQFAVKDPKDYLRYIMIVFKEFGLSQKTTKLSVWGNETPQSPIMILLKKYIRNISFGHRPSHQKYGYVFDEVQDQQYFDVFSIFLCD